MGGGFVGASVTGPRLVIDTAPDPIDSEPDRHDLGKALSQASTSRSASGTAAVSVTIPMQHVEQCDTSVTLSAEPDGGANA